jgi:hypothetical protein
MAKAESAKGVKYRSGNESVMAAYQCRRENCLHQWRNGWRGENGGGESGYRGVKSNNVTMAAIG